MVPRREPIRVQGQALPLTGCVTLELTKHLSGPLEVELQGCDSRPAENREVRGGAVRDSVKGRGSGQAGQEDSTSTHRLAS